MEPFTRGGRAEGVLSAGWDIRQLHTDPDPAQARRAVLADLENGASSLWLVAGAERIPAKGIGEVLADVHLQMAPVMLESGADYETACASLLSAWAERGYAPETVRGNLGIDPISVAARSGEPADLAPAARLAAEYTSRYPLLGLVTVDGAPVHDAGGSHAQELGASMAAGVAYLRALTEAGMGLAEAAERLEFRYTATADQFLSIAKLRAARAMWDRVTEACGLAAEHRTMRQHAVTSAAMMTRRDPHVNIVRTTLACFGAGVAGADAITVRPFDSALGLPGDFARRIARNTQSLLVEESHLARVIDPAGGSFYVERLTADLYAQGWAFFQELEAAGGMAAALSSGLVTERVNEVWEQRRSNIAHRRDPLTGVSEFPELDERPAPTPDDEGRPAAANALPRRRYAEDFEALRDRSDAHLAATGARPAVFLATLGPASAHTARATFVGNLLRSGGIAPAGGRTCGDADEAVAAFRESDARLACLCSSDAVYAEQAAAAVRALKEAGAERVLLAGKPSDDLAAAGVDGFLFADCDALGLLDELLDTLGVAE